MKAAARSGLRPTYRSKAEAEWAWHLHARSCGSSAEGGLSWWGYEPVTFTLAPGTRYTPDFMVILPDGTVEFHEVKGFMREAARVRINVAAKTYPMFRFVIVWARKGGNFETEEVPAA